MLRFKHCIICYLGIRRTKKLLTYIPRIMTLAILLSPLAVLSPAEALPGGVPEARCGTVSNPTPGTLCYTLTRGGGKVNAGESPKEWVTDIQATEGEYVVADVVVEVLSEAGDRNNPTVNHLSKEGKASVTSEHIDKLTKLQEMRFDLEAKITGLSGPALSEAQAKLSALQRQEQTYEQIVKSVTEAGNDVGKYRVVASARSRSCGWGWGGGFDTCGSWVDYNIYVVRRYVGNPIVAYNKSLEVARDAQKTILNLVEQSQQTGTTRNDNKPISKESVFSLFHKFITAWNNKDYEQQISCLSSDFYYVDAEKRQDYSQYLSNKKRLFSKYGYVSVEFSNEHYAVLNAHEATISYHQTYKSPCYQSEGKNTLYFTMLNGQVKISREEFRRDSYNTMKCD